MTQKRKEQLANEMLGYICELVHSNEEIFNVLHGTLGMTREEMDAFGIDYLDEFFQSDVLYAKLMEKVERSYRALMSKWMDMFPDEIIERYDKVHAVCVAYRLLKKRAVTDAEVAWLFRFRDPLAVVSDAWQKANDLNCIICEDRLGVLIREMRDCGSAEDDYEMDGYMH